MKILTITVLILILLPLSFLASPCGASEQAHQFLSGLEAYKKGDFSAAIEQFSAIVQEGVVNGPLFYNLGDAYLKNNDLGSAILWYERAQRLIPSDPDLQFNLKYARSLTKDASEENISPLVRIFFFWRYQLTAQAIKFIAISSNLLFWLFLGAWRLTRRRGFARSAMVAAAPALIFVLTAAFNYYEGRQVLQAIVLPAQVAIRAGLDDSATQLFQLHAGTKVTVVKELKSYYQIRYSSDKIGWVKKEAVGVI
jgi:hypothetical protein